MHNMKNEVKGQHRTAENCRAFLDPQRQIYDTQNLTHELNSFNFHTNVIRHIHLFLSLSLCLSPVCGKV